MPRAEDEERARLDAGEIYDIVHADALSELKRDFSVLALSGLLAGLVMGLTAVSVAAAHAALDGVGGERFLANLLYPVGFLAVILGRSQLFTENTLYPVIATLEDRRWLKRTLQLWGVVFCANVVGAFLFALVAVVSPALAPDVMTELVALGDEAAEGAFAENFWSGIFGGFLIALVAWLVAAAQTTSGRFLAIFVLTFAVGLGGFDHCIAGAAEVWSALLDGTLGVAESVEWLLAATLGNIAGGVLIVSGLNYGQTREDGR